MQHWIKSLCLSTFIIVGLVAHSKTVQAAGTETLVVAGGCFWCVEHDFESVRGVKEAVSGFTGGSVKNPSYKQVTGGGTGHYEAVKITFDSGKVSREQLLNLFLRSIDVTDAGGQFCDRGNSYRSAIFVSNAAEKAVAQAAIAKAQSDLGQRVVTPVVSAQTFYPADASHQNYSKGSKIVLTRFGPKKQSAAYKAYRDACGRDQRVQQLWGSAAPFVGN